ncbi:MAG TPA: hypothetical protein VHK69_07780 [Chitinophagaceae bacterium]|nr:hypothetical protein [Chitinophagaceae bacterium]
MTTRILTVLLAALVLLSCRKAEEKAEEAALDAAINGEWLVKSYLKGDSNLTSGFAPYTFKFQLNNTVDAYRNGALEKTGSWDSDISTRTITSSFPVSEAPLSLLNGTWTVTKNSWEYVEAEQSVNGTEFRLRLEKK